MAFDKAVEDVLSVASEISILGAPMPDDWLATLTDAWAHAHVRPARMVAAEL